jgi:hypothetical protein
MTGQSFSHFVTVGVNMDSVSTSPLSVFACNTRTPLECSNDYWLQIMGINIFS